jgi:hypothetical protein
MAAEETMIVSVSRRVSFLALLLGVGSIAAWTADATEAQHQDWARKFQTPAGTTNGEAMEAPVDMRTEVDIRRLLRCEIYQQYVKAKSPPLDGC